MERILPGQHPLKERMSFCPYEIEDNSSFKKHKWNYTCLESERNIFFSYKIKLLEKDKKRSLKSSQLNVNI